MKSREDLINGKQKIETLFMDLSVNKNISKSTQNQDFRRYKKSKQPCAPLQFCNHLPEDR
jgi:hypothetical protein